MQVTWARTLRPTVLSSLHFFAMPRGLRDLSSQGLNSGHGSESVKS